MSRFITFFIFAISAAIFASPIYENFGYWGQMDWDQFTMWNAVPYRTIMEYGQFPLWNPYVNGGNVMLAHPHSPILSPFYVFVLIFGPIAGLKIQIPVHLFIGLYGMFFLGKQFDLGRLARYFSAFVFMFCSMFVLHLTEGHTEWFSMAFVPWYVAFFLKSLDDKKYVFGGIMSLALILLNGSVDVFNIMLVFMGIFAIFKAIKNREVRALKMISVIWLGTFLLCSAKLLPMLEFLSEFPRTTEENSAVPVSALYHIFLDTDQEVLDMMNWEETRKMGLDYDWHEYGAYIGWIPLLLGLYGFVVYFGHLWPLIGTGIVMFIIGMGSGSILNLWYVLHQLPFFDSLTVPSRFMLGFVFVIAIVSGKVFQSIESFIRQKDQSSKSRFKLGWLIYVLLTIVIVDLYESNSGVFSNAFVIKPKVLQENTYFAQRYQYVNLYGKRLSNSSLYPLFLANSGVLDAYEVTQVKQGEVRRVTESDYRGEYYLDRPQGEITLVDFTPNRVTLDVNLKEPNLVVLNQNFHKGWKVRAADQSLKAVASEGLVSAFVPAGSYRLDLYYRPDSFVVGVIISLGFILFSAGMIITGRWRFV